MAKREQTAIEATIATQPSGTPYGLTLTFANGATLGLTLGQLSADMREAAAIHGLKQKLVDAAAISRNPDTGASATVEDKYRAVKAVYDRLLAGEWNAKRGEGGASAGSLLFRALVRVYPSKTAEELRAFIDGLDKSKQAALRANPKIAPVIEAIKAEDAARAGDAGKDNSDDLLAGLES